MTGRHLINHARFSTNAFISLTLFFSSPSGKTLRTQFQIKDYLLTQGTCKCGLPCPLRPEYLFDFNAQVSQVRQTKVAANGAGANIYNAQVGWK